METNYSITQYMGTFSYTGQLRYSDLEPIPTTSLKPPLTSPSLRVFDNVTFRFYFDTQKIIFWTQSLEDLENALSHLQSHLQNISFSEYTIKNWSGQVEWSEPLNLEILLDHIPRATFIENSGSILVAYQDLVKFNVFATGKINFFAKNQDVIIPALEYLHELLVHAAPDLSLETDALDFF